MATQMGWTFGGPLAARSVHREGGLFRHSPADAFLVAAALLHAGFVVTLFLGVAPRGPLGLSFTALAFGGSLCWNSNTVSHNHLHKPFFRFRTLNRTLSLLLTAVMGVPQSIWRARHYWHHAGEPAGQKPQRLTVENLAEVALVAAIWLGMLFAVPERFLFAYLPGYGLGLALCHVQGRMEHALVDRPLRGLSYYGRLHNLVWFNDGYHAEHHRWPAEHWTRLPARRGEVNAPGSAWPPLLRLLEHAPTLGARWQAAALTALERLALRSARLQRFMVSTHERAFRRLIAGADQAPIKHIAVIGGGLFPRTVIVLRKMFPESRIAVIDYSDASVRTAREFLRGRGELSGIEFRVEEFSPSRHSDFDLLVAPLAFVGARRALGRVRCRVAVVVHDWLWHRSGERSETVSWLLLKRVNLFRGRAAGLAGHAPER